MSIPMMFFVYLSISSIDVILFVYLSYMLGCFI
jgi:hypothetical protein